MQRLILFNIFSLFTQLIKFYQFKKMNEDDRPIHPNKEYLQQEERKYQESLRIVHPYLKKKQIQSLPCHQQKRQQSPFAKNKNKLTKKQQYEKIKEQNRERYGEWEKKPKVVQQPPKKKINPKQMTVSYQKKQIKIDTEEYKNPNFQKTDKKEKEDGKIEYEKMIQYLRKEIINFQEEKQRFEQQREMLKFKKVIQDEKGFMEIRGKVSQCWEKKKNLHEEIEQENQQNINKLEDDLGFSQEVKKYQLPIYKLDECPDYSLPAMQQYLDFSTLLPYNNPYYQEALKTGEKHRSKALVCHNSKKRITDFQNGWIEVWTAGKQRVMGKENYTIRWWSNGDIKQSFPNGFISYYAHDSRLVQFWQQGKAPFHYFPDLQQLQQTVPGGREVIFKDGRHQLISK